MTVKKKRLSKSAVVKSKWLVRIPEGARVEVSSGMKVKKGEVLLVCEVAKISSYNELSFLSRMSLGRLKELNDSLCGREFKEGDLLFADGGLFPKKLFSPCSGKFCGVDEFLNIQFQLIIGNRKEVIAPVDSKVLRVDKEELVLEFNSLKYEGTGLVSGKVWGESDMKIRNKISELTSALAGKIVFTTEASPAYVIKAEVVGVAGLVMPEPVGTDFKEIETGFPVMSLAKTEWDNLMADQPLEGERRMLLNSKVGRLLLVVQ